MKIIQGNCLDILKEMEDNSVDAIVTDPPYGLSFMGKKWDYDVPSVEIWQECLRVLKPGGYLLAFAGTRTQHRMAVRIEDAGFEIRDMIAWVYGSGFPKSLNIGKAVDKLQGNERELLATETRYNEPSGIVSIGQGERTLIDRKITKGTSEWEGWGTALKPSWESITVAQKQLDRSSIDMIELVHIIKKTLCLSQSNALIAEQILKLNHSEQNEEVNIAQWVAKKNIDILEDLSVLMDMLQLESEKNLNWNIVLLWLNILGDLYKQTNIFTTSTELNTTIELKTLLSMEWENIFQNIIQAKDNQTNGLSANVWNAESIFNALRLKLRTIQELSVQENAISKEKEISFAPNLSPIIMSRKPLTEKTVAENCLKWGVGGINIDESRVETEDNRARRNNTEPGFCGGWGTKDTENNPMGRFPANLVHDGSNEVVELFPNSKSGNGKANTYEKEGGQWGKGKQIRNADFGDSGSAARFFKECKFDNECSLCYNPLCKDNNKEICQNNNKSVPSAEKNSGNMNQTTEHIVHLNVEESQEDKLDQLVRSVGNLCQKCTTSIAQDIVKISNWDSNKEELRVIQDFIGNYKKCSLLQNLVNYVELMDSIDTTQTTKNLLKLFGSANRVIISYIQETEKSALKRFLYQAKASKSERNRGCEELEAKFSPTMGNGIGVKEHDPETATKKNNFHPTVKPISLMEYLIKLVSREGATVLDPFMGSGSTGIACKKLNRNFIGIEMNEEYIKIANARICSYS